MAVVEAPDVVVVGTPHGRVRVRDTGGDGPPVLLVHSVLLDPDLYATVVPDLVSRGYRCVLPELPFGAHVLPMAEGADLTPLGLARLLVEVLDALGLARVHVVGVDTGGALTQLLMAHHRDRVGSVVLTGCDAYEHFPPRSPLGWAVRPLFWPGVLTAASRVMRLAPARRLLVMRPVSHRGTDDATLVRWTTPLRDPRVRCDVRAAVRGMHPRYTLRAAELNRDFPRPVLVAWGDDDRFFPRGLAERLERDLPDSRLVTLPDCAAFAPLDQPALLARLVHEHLGGAHPGPAARDQAETTS